MTSACRVQIVVGATLMLCVMLGCSEQGGGGDTAAKDTVAEDTAAKDTAAEDTAAKDAAAEDTAAKDAAAEDTAAEDTAVEDTAAEDTAAEDTAAKDAAANDTTVDAGALSDVNGTQADAGANTETDTNTDTSAVTDALTDIGTDTTTPTDAIGDTSSTLPDVTPDASAPDTQADSQADSQADTQADSQADTTAPQKPGYIDPKTLALTKFTEVTKTFAINPDGYYGACVAAGDIDNDGRDDFLVIERKTTKAIIWAHLLGGPKAKQVSSDFDTTQMLPTLGCQLVDLNSDGHLDLLVGGNSGAALYTGDGKGTFKDQTNKYLPYILDFEGWSLAPADLDGDGDLDIFVGAGAPSDNAQDRGPGPACGTSKCGYQEHDFICAMTKGMPTYTGTQDRVLIQGAKLPFTDETKAWGPPSGGILSAAVPIDIDDDGKIDMLVGDDFGAHRLLHNKGGKFVAHDKDIGFYTYGHAMGWGLGDFNDDGKADLILADVGPVPVYVQVAATNGLPVKFVDKGGEYGIWGPLWATSSWTPMVADFDHDGRDDIMFGGALNTTPAKLPAITSSCSDGKSNPYKGHDNLDTIFLSDGKKTGAPYTAQRFKGGPLSNFNTIAQVVLDIDDDGDLDIVQSRPHVALLSRIRVWRNDLPKKGGSAVVRLVGKKGNMEAVGAKVTAKIGGLLRTRWLVGGGGFGGTRLRMAHFGLGKTNKATDVTVHWPDGKKTKLGELKPGDKKAAKWP